MQCLSSAEIFIVSCPFVIKKSKSKCKYFLALVLSKRTFCASNFIPTSSMLYVIKHSFTPKIVENKSKLNAAGFSSFCSCLGKISIKSEVFTKILSARSFFTIIRFAQISLKENSVSKLFRTSICLLFFVSVNSSKVKPIFGLKLVASFGFLIDKSAFKNSVTSFTATLFNHALETSFGNV